MSKIAIIVGSVRPNRFGPHVGEWVYNLATNYKEATFEIIDIADYDLPLLDEPYPPMAGNYQNSHTKKWAQKIAGFDGFIFITPEYNHGVAASLKNALDFLYAEWNDKPVAYVSYGAGAGGSRAVEQLRQIAAQLRQYDILEQVIILNSWEHKDEKGKFIAKEDHVAQAEALLKEIVFWSAAFKDIRKKR